MGTPLYEQYRHCPFCEKPFIYPFQQEKFFEHIEKCVHTRSDEDIYDICEREGVSID